MYVLEALKRWLRGELSHRPILVLIVMSSLYYSRTYYYFINSNIIYVFILAEWWLNYGECAPTLRTIATKVLSQTTSSSNYKRNWSTFSFIHTSPRNRLTMQKLNKLAYIHYNRKLRSRNRKRRQFEDQRDYFCPINLDYIFSEEDTALGEWLEE